MEPINFQDLFTTGGISLTIAGIAYKAITQLYKDMRDDSKAREEGLMRLVVEQREHQQKQDEKQMEINIKTIETLEHISTEMQNMNNRLCSVEKIVQKEV